jgi:hypothetical protein
VMSMAESSSYSVVESGTVNLEAQLHGCDYE